MSRLEENSIVWGDTKAYPPQADNLYQTYPETTFPQKIHRRVVNDNDTGEEDIGDQQETQRHGREC